jgi:hypothetical protein
VRREWPGRPLWKPFNHAISLKKKREKSAQEEEKGIINNIAWTPTEKKINNNFFIYINVFSVALFPGWPCLIDRVAKTVLVYWPWAFASIFPHWYTRNVELHQVSCRK